MQPPVERPPSRVTSQSTLAGSSRDATSQVTPPPSPKEGAGSANTVGEVLQKTQAFFHKAGIDTARLDAEILIAFGLGLRRIDLYLKHEQPLKLEELAKLRELVVRRSKKEPVAYLIGKKEFFGEEFLVDPNVLIPRPETEFVVDAAIEAIQSEGWFAKEKKSKKMIPLGGEQVTEAASSASAVVDAPQTEASPPMTTLGAQPTESVTEHPAAGGTVASASADGDTNTVSEPQHLQPLSRIELADWGCGSGCIGISILKNVSNATLTAVDISAGALGVARKNAERLGVESRTRFIESSVEDLTEPPKFHVIVANPPYIEKGDPQLHADVEKYEPHTALFSDKQGFGCIERWSQKAAACLVPGGYWIFELGAGQAPNAKACLEATRLFSSVRIQKDYAGIERVIVAKRGNE
jgi:release factor glutamine methyltransferase